MFHDRRHWLKHQTLFFGEASAAWCVLDLALTDFSKSGIIHLKRGVGSALGAEGLPPSESPSGPAVTPALPDPLAPSVTPFFELPEGLSFLAV